MGLLLQFPNKFLDDSPPCRPPADGHWRLLGWKRVNAISRAITLKASIAFLILLTGCAAKEVVVQGDFPAPLLQKSPLKMGVVYRPEFSGHEIYDPAKVREDSDWVVKTGNAQVEFWTKFFEGLFSEVIVISSAADLIENLTNLDAVLFPEILELQYTTPKKTNVKIYELWMKYRFTLAFPTRVSEDEDSNLFVDPVDQIASWTLVAYGKTPTALLQSDEAAVNLAAVVALRDAGAHFVTYNHRNSRDPCANWTRCDTIWRDLIGYQGSAAEQDSL